jgi:hypothetical protein
VTGPSLTPIRPVRLTPAALRIHRAGSRRSLAMVYQINALLTAREIELIRAFMARRRA